MDYDDLLRKLVELEQVMLIAEGEAGKALAEVSDEDIDAVYDKLKEFDYSERAKQLRDNYNYTCSQEDNLNKYSRKL